jgi:hypothetical protein
MTPAEAALVLAQAARFDLRTVGRADAEAWADALWGLDPKRCIQAVNRHYANETDRIMPAHIRRLARTTTDLHDGTDAAMLRDLPDGQTICGDCKLVHHRHEPCAGRPGTPLITDDTRWRRAVESSKRPPRPTHADYRPLRAVAPPRETGPGRAARDEAERARQLAALEPLIETDTVTATNAQETA